MSVALGLYRLQQIDSQMDSTRSRLDAIRKTLENDAELQEALNQVAAAEMSLREAESRQRAVEAESQAQRIKIEQTESSLYGGVVHNPKELQDLQRDVVSLKKHLASLDDQVLEAMLAVETAAEHFKTARAGLARIESMRGDQTRKLTGEQGDLLHRIERFESERKAAMTPLDGSAVALYESLRNDRRGVAVTTLSDGSCDACGTTLTPAQQQNARHSMQLFRCPTCGRILFAD
jgi:predicted  nucleic acid-binding Zn-ribbon protein